VPHGHNLAFFRDAPDEVKNLPVELFVLVRGQQAGHTIPKIYNAKRVPYVGKFQYVCFGIEPNHGSS